MTDRLAELGALQYAVENLSTAGTNPNRLALAGYIHAAYTDYQAWAAANPGVNPNRLSAKGRLYGYFYDNASWSPLSLFAASEVGAWYDPSDLTTMFQDRAGSTPVTADGQTVGFMFDKSKGLAETNIAFTLNEYEGNGAVTMATSGNVITMTNALNTDGVIDSTVYPTSGYSFCDFTASGTGQITVFAGGSQTVITLSATPTTYRAFTAENYSIWLIFRGSAGGTTGTITVHKAGNILGNHAVAPSDAARPLKTSTGLSKWINYDAVDDVLNSTFPSSLGSSCTVARANVGSSPTILTSQTIGTSYADSTDHAGLIIINRALTGQETTDLTAWLTAKGATA